MSLSVLAVPFRQLVERRLWPLAVLLVLALAAVVVLLRQDAAPAPAPAAGAAAPAGAAIAGQPVVSVVAPGAGEDTRQVVGSRKDPFRPATARRSSSTGTTAPTEATAGTGSSTKDQSTATAKGGSGGGGGASAPAGGGTGVTTPVTPVAPKPVYELYSLRVRFGETSSEDLGSSVLKRLTPLPSVQEPVVIYLGLKADKKTAIFLVDAGADVQGDGKCSPDPANCQTLTLKPGETAFFDTTDAAGAVKQYQLDLVKVLKRKTTNAQAAAKARSSYHRGGRRALRARMGRVGPLRYDAKTGVVKKMSARAYRAQVARASAASK